MGLQWSTAILPAKQRWVGRKSLRAVNWLRQKPPNQEEAGESGDLGRPSPLFPNGRKPFAQIGFRGWGRKGSEEQEDLIQRALQESEQR